MQKILPVFILLLFIVLFSSAQTPAPDYRILFKTGTIQPEPNPADLLNPGTPAPEQVFSGRFFRIIQFFEIPSEGARDELEAAGIELLGYLPNTAWFASFDQDFRKEVLINKSIRSIITVDPVYKLDPVLLHGNYPGHALKPGNRIAVEVSYYPNLDAGAVEEALTRAGAVITGHDSFGRTVRAEIPVAGIMHMAGLPFVSFLEPVAPEPTPENYTGRTLHHTNVIATDFLTGRHYDGTGVNIMLQDDGVIGPHIDYQGRIGAQYLTNNNGNHGDHCAGILMAAGNKDPKGKGNAFGATLWVYSVSPNYPGFNAIPTVYNSLGIRVTSCSYGDGCNSGYTSLARTLDQQVRNYPGLMHVFSAGNSGTSDCGYGAGPGWGNITGGHKMGKNVFAVANLNSQDIADNSSSRGPATDGRIKPDLGAKGSDVYSTIDPNDYDIKSGTSMACPGVAGSLSQLIHAYRSLKNGKDPMTGLIKGIVLNTAEDLGNPGPDFVYGWGRINALRAVKVIEENRYDTGVITQGATVNHTIIVPPGTAQLRVMVYWTDYEGTVNATQALVNNLNVTLTDPASVLWKPWILNSYPDPDSLNKPAVRGIDNLNNMEQVTIDNPSAGSYLLAVTGATIPQGPQTYYVIYEFIPEGVVLTYPIGGESLVPGEAELIRWDAFGNSGTFALSWSADNGQTWTEINANITGSSRTYTWTVPASITGQALVKVARNGMESQSDAPFSIIGVPCNVAVDWECGDTLHVSWNPVPDATAYEVFKLGNKYMDPAGVTSGTSMIINGISASTSTWLSVRALGPDGATGRRAIAIEKAPGNFNCHPVDLMMTAAPSAEWGVFYTSLDLSQVKVPVLIRNYGSKPVTNPTLKYRIDNGIVHTGTYSGTILPDSVVSFVFAETMDLSATGSYIFKSWAECPGDLNPDNDSLIYPLEVIDATAVAIGYVQTFESWTKCSTAPVCELYSCPLEEGWQNLENGTYDAHDWRTYSGSTPTSASGPDFDHTTGNTTGKYLYIEPTMNCLNKVAIISTPSIDLTGAIHPGLSIWFNAYGADIGSMHIDLFNGSEVFNDVAVPVSGNKGNVWKELTADLTPWAGKVIGLRIRGITSCKDKGDLAIDDFRVSEVISSIGTGNTGKNAGMVVFPNPARQQVTVTVPEPGAAPVSVKLLDIYGKTVYRAEVTAVAGMVRKTIGIAHLPAGLYLIEVRTTSSSSREKLIISH